MTTNNDLKVTQRKLDSMMVIAGEVLYVQGFQHIQSELNNAYRAYKVALELDAEVKK